MSSKDDPNGWGNLPVRTEMTVLGPDDPEAAKRILSGLPDI